MSKKQLRLTAEYSRKIVKVEVLGSNASVIAGDNFESGEKPKLLKIGDRFHLLADQYEYELKIDQPEVPRPQKMTGNPPHSSHWSQGLYASMNDPDMKMYQDDKVVIIKDKYPKATHHFLALPLEKIKDLASMDRTHLPLLEHMHAKSLELTTSNYPGFELLLGYHAIPSMAQVHLHIISQDYDSPCLKTKRHWNSFTTDYFLPSDKVVKELQTLGHVRLATSEEGKALLNRDLKCHKCEFAPKNMPDLKKHLKKHV